MFQSDLFIGLQKRAHAWTEMPGDLGWVAGLIYMLVIIPLCAIAVLGLVIMALPGIVVNAVLWQILAGESLEPRRRILHDITLLLCGAVSIYFLFGNLPHYDCGMMEVTALGC